MRVLLLCIIVLCYFIKVGAQSPTYQLAETAFQIGNYTEAINLYAKDTSVRAQLQIARAYNALGDYQKSTKQYQSVVKADSTFLVAQNELGKLYFKLAAIENARKLYESLIEKDKTNPFYFYQLGRIANEQFNNKKAVEYFKESYYLDSSNIKNIYQIGKYYLKTRQFDSVHKYADVGLKLAPNSVDVNNLKALAYYNFGEKEGAVSYLEKLIELGQKETYIYKYLAQCYEFLWKYDQALECYKKVLEIDNSDPEGYNGLGHLYYLKKEYESAKINFKTAIDVQRVSLAREYTALANISLEENDLRKGIDYYRKAYEQDTSNYRLLYQVCFYSDKYYKDDQYKLQLYEDFLEHFPDIEYYSEYASRRISEIKKEIHLVSN